MSSDPQPSAPTAPVEWPNLTPNERRVLGVLVEKAKTTPDAYPLSLNSLVTGCNQKSNRDPVLNLSDVDVEDALASLQKKLLAIKVQSSGRVERWRHNLYEAWQVDKIELAVLGELLLRGPQTEGELRTRASRMEPIDDLDGLRARLRPLTDRRLVAYLTPQGRRGTMLTHGFHPPAELERLRTKHSAGIGDSDEETPAPAPPRAVAAPSPPPPAALDAVRAEVAVLRTTVATLQAAVADLSEQVRGLKEALGA